MAKMKKGQTRLSKVVKHPVNQSPAAALKMKKKKKLKKQKELTQWVEEVFDEDLVNLEQCVKPPPTVDRNISNSKANGCNSDLATKAVKRKKKPQKEVFDETSFNIDLYRDPKENEEHWILRRGFLEKNQHNLSPDELICLAQVYMNMELLGCRYPPETMEMVAKLSEGLGRDYHRARALMLKRTFISASDAAACKVRKLNPADTVAQNKDSPLNTDVQSTIPSTVLNSLRRDFIMFGQDMPHSVEIFNRLKNGVKIETCVNKFHTKSVEGIVKIGNFTIAKSTDNDARKAVQIALRKSRDFFSQYCYTLTHKNPVNEMDGIEVVSKSECENGKKSGTSSSSWKELKADNVGFKLLAKLGWNGGSLGVRGDGIVDPVAVDQSHQFREGLGTDSKDPKLSRDLIMKKLADFQTGNNSDHQIVFSSEYSKQDRKHIHSIASKMNLQSRSYGKEGRDRKLVVTRKHHLQANELIKKIVVEKDPWYCQMYEVTFPAELA